MGLIQFSIVDIEDAVDEIKIFIKDAYSKVEVDLQTENNLADIFDVFKDGLSLYIEYPYVDKVYRDSYYTYFSSKHNEYHRDSIRVCLFSKAIYPDYFRKKKRQKYLQDCFLGYIIIRPTFPNVIGRSLLNKKTLKDANFINCTCKGSVTVNGVKLEVEGFPHSSQDTESISCAETTIGGLMEYFGNRYPDYKPALPSTILNALSHYSKQRMLPSNGLTVEQISYALKEFGFGTYIYSRDDAYDIEIENLIATYIESGIPLIAALENDQIGHAVLIIGHDNDSEINFKKQKTKELDFTGKTINYIDYTDIFKKFVIQDDNLPPYRLIDLSNPAEHYGANPEFAGCTIKSIVVPLYKKVYLEADKAKQFVLAIVSDVDFGFNFNERFIFRFFLTSSRSFKHHISQLNDLDGDIKNILVLSRMPKFVWCGEFYKRNDYKHNKVGGLIVIDATEAGASQKDALIFAGYPHQCVYKFGKEFVYLKKGFNLCSKFKNNLL